MFGVIMILFSVFWFWFSKESVDEGDGGMAVLCFLMGAFDLVIGIIKIGGGK